MKLYYSTDPNLLANRCLDELNEYTREDPMRRAFLIVPESMKADLERRYLEQHNKQGLMMAEVLSFNRLAYRLSSEVGGLAVQRLSLAGKSLLLQNILQRAGNKNPNERKVATGTKLSTEVPVTATSDQAVSDSLNPGKSSSTEQISAAEERQFRRFARFVGRPGFATELATVIGDFSRYDITATDLRATATIAPTVITRDKLFDFALLLEHYRETLAAYDLIDPDQDLDRLAALLRNFNKEPRLAFLKETAVWVLGFGETRAFTAQEQEILGQLERHCASLTVTINCDRLDERSDPIYSHGKDTVRQLQRLSGNCDWQQIPSTVKKPSVTVVYAPDAREEMRFVFGEIRRLLIESDFRGRDIGIALAEPDTYGDLIVSTAQIYGIPIFIDRRKALSQSSFLRHIDALLEYILTRPDYKTIMLYLRSGYSQLSIQTIDDYDNLCLAAGLIKPHDFSGFDPERLLATGKLSPCQYRTWQQVRAVLKPVDDLGALVRQKRSGANKLELIFTWLLKHSFPQLENRVARLRQNEEKEAALILASSWNQWLEFKEEALSIMRSLLLSQLDFTRLLRAALAGFSHSSIPVGIDSVRVGNLRQMTVYPTQVLFVVGTNENNFPPRGSEEGYLRDAERMLLSEHSNKKFPNHKEDLPIAREWQQHRLLTGPKSKLHISTPSLNRDQASLVQKQLESDPETEIISLALPFAPSAAWNVGQIARLRLNLALSDPIERHNLQVDWLIGLQALSRLDKDTEVGLYPEREAEELIIPSHLVESVVLPRATISVSQLQKYNHCPYSYFGTYLLRLRERDHWQPSAREQGSLLHAMMELTIAELIRRLQGAKTPSSKAEITENWSRSLTIASLDKYFENAIEMTGLAHFNFPETRGQMKRRLLNHLTATLQLTAEQIRRDLLFPEAVEWHFPLPGKDNFTLKSGLWQATLQGTVDRVDTGTDGFVLIDYKRGGKQILYADIVHGLNLQLPLYLKVYNQLYPQAIPKGLAYFTFADKRSDNRKGIMPTVTSNSELLRDAFDKQSIVLEQEKLTLLADFAAERARSSMANILKGDIGARPTVLRAGQSPCSYCAYKAHCQYDDRTGRDRARLDVTPAQYEKVAEAKIAAWRPGEVL